MQRTVTIKATSRELAQERAELAFGEYGVVVDVEQVLFNEWRVTFESDED